ncbi:MAG: 2-hydroxyacyl-CoA dehydratase family protein [Peptoniphilus sp.]|nr:2-hydroxyacyl-CoA dehydratase family protein [Peptoniphilus sp.]MDY6045183.1 2-hydroxyacyl-CoA dehydratase family protein [Peptoniphilus sp.]
MIKSTEDFGKYIEKTVQDAPERAGRRLLAGYKLFGAKLKYFPDKRLPPARQKLAVYMNETVRKVFERPESVALVNIFMPCEIFQAMDIVPMCAELFSGFINGTHCERVFVEAAEREGISETYCSYHKTMIGTAYMDLLKPPKAIVNTSFVCDANNLTFKEAAAHFDVPHYYIEVPTEQSEESVAYVAHQLKEVVQLLEEVTGRRMDEEKLKRAVGRSAETVDLFKKILEQKKTKYLPGDVTSEMYEACMIHNGMGTEACYDYAKTLLRDFEGAEAFEGTKILWLHTIPNWQEPVRALFNFNERCQIITCDMNFDNLVEMDPKKPYESMARRLIYSNWNTGRSRVQSAIDMAKALDVDGAICFCQWGCKEVMGLSGLFKEHFEREGIPALILDGDGADRRNASDGQTSTRLNAFMEMLERKNYEQ